MHPHPHPTPRHVLVSGPGDARPVDEQRAEEVGRLLAAAGAITLTGGLGGAMAAACRGARGAGGLTVALLPGSDRAAANPHVTVALPTGLGELRNGLLVRAADAVIAIGGGHGTLSEVALALRAGRTVAGLDTWDIPGVVAASDPAHAVALALARRA